MLLGTARSYAQSVDSLQVVVDSLSVRVAKLEHDLTYRKMYAEMESLYFQLEILTLNVGNIMSDLQIANLTKNLKNMKIQLQEIFEGYKKRLEIYKDMIVKMQERIESNKRIFLPLEELQIESQKLLVLHSYNMLEGEISIIEKAFGSL